MKMIKQPTIPPMPKRPTFDARDTQYNLPIGTDCISRRSAIEIVEKYFKKIGLNGDICVDGLRQLPPIQPTNNLQKLADEIASFKRHVKSDNSDYLTGYLCALSVVEGMIAEKREVTT